jgi:hypothetical protein
LYNGEVKKTIIMHGLGCYHGSWERPSSAVGPQQLGTITGAGYIEHILPTLQDYWRDTVANNEGDPARITVVQDNAPVHTA